MNKYAIIFAMGGFLFFSTLHATPDSSDSAEKINCFMKAYQEFFSFNKKDLNGRTYLCFSKKNCLLWDSHQLKTYETKIKNPDLSDMVSIPYPKGRPIAIPPKFLEDPGRFRNIDFFKTIYGDSEAQVRNHLVKIPWLPKTLGKNSYVWFNQVNGAAKALQKVSDALDRLPPPFKKYLLRCGGTFEWRTVRDTHQLSAHAFGIAIDIGGPFSNYWYWHTNSNSQKTPLVYQDRMPQEIIDIFEKYHFIWGGRWYHYDTMHFEYRPEFFVKECIRSV